MHLVIAGPPASGKGTQCELIVERYGVVHISTGDILRAEVKAGTANGREAKRCMEAGGLVPDALITKMVIARIGKSDVRQRGYLLDGFPRTAAQAKSLSKVTTVDAFVLLTTPDNVLVGRAVGRRLDPKTGVIYHLTYKPPPTNDPALTRRLVHRSDDTEETVGKRLATYHATIGPIKTHFEPCLSLIDANRKPTTIAGDIFAAVDVVGAYKAPAARGEITEPLHLVIAGPPASGKGTQCELIVRRYGIVHISTGDILRAEVKAGTANGREAKRCMEAGGLVPDALITKMVIARIGKSDVRQRGYLLDGFPRTAAQAKSLSKVTTVDAFVLLTTPDNVLVGRAVGRRLDPKTGVIYHLTYKPPPTNDPALTRRLVHRSDDTEETVGKRLATYHATIGPIKTHFEPCLSLIDANRKPTTIAGDIFAALDGKAFKSAATSSLVVRSHVAPPARL